MDQRPFWRGVNTRGGAKPKTENRKPPIANCISFLPAGGFTDKNQRTNAGQYHQLEHAVIVYSQEGKMTMLKKGSSGREISQTKKQHFKEG